MNHKYLVADYTLIIPKIVTAVIVNPPYVAYVKPTGIIFIALDRQNKHRTIVDYTKNCWKMICKTIGSF